MPENATDRLESFLNSYQLFEVAMATSDRLGIQVDEIKQELQMENILPQEGDVQFLYGKAAELISAGLRGSRH